MAVLIGWLSVAGAFAALWYSLLTSKLTIPGVEADSLLVVGLPIITLALLGVYAVFTIGYRVANFNDTPKAAEELQKEIEEARRELRSMGVDVGK
eukprot:CAMPEP_0113897894 /NCGR_PEP_ID=MMETSP0780_2-20120614/19003_1 /TAXON_ID=652834 /ORGANISM="Palpitomonas bilix" /LENGTH=94 /DNA_ID=CAMNT_0000889549 /DNA_START=123 /DNA_END=407 /DNA_ORIENTATION=- /assembly_acc=CAM_ASM_000599